LEVPLLEKKKRPPTRHPRDLDAHFWSIWSAIDAARSQVTMQAKILFSLPKFATQNLVVLVASSGEYYRLAVLPRGHQALAKVPSSDDIMDLIANPTEGVDPAEITTALRAELVVSGRSLAELEKQRLDAMRKAERAETERQIDARDARAFALEQRQKNMSRMSSLERELSQIVIDAGEPEIDSGVYSDHWIETYYNAFRRLQAAKHNWSHYQRYPTFFEPEPPSNEITATLTNLRNPSDDREIVFTGVIRLGSPVSEKFFQIIRRHLSSLGEIERSQRK
jgi:hypothetical protein